MGKGVKKHKLHFTATGQCCSVRRCYGAIYAKGLCKTHYQFTKNHRKPKGKADKCSVDGCERAWTAQGLCQMHYWRKKKTGKTGPAEKLRGPKGTCSIPGCKRKNLARNMCNMHYRRWSKTGDAGPGYSTWECRHHCAIPGCHKKHVGLGLCAMHRMRLKTSGKVGAAKSSKGKKGWFLNRGYKMLTGIKHPNSSRNSTTIMEHVLVMSNLLGRPLKKGESVHHKNGVKDDNRIDNLELWVKTQPSGQRVKDRIADALWLLSQYIGDKSLWTKTQIALAKSLVETSAAGRK